MGPFPGFGEVQNNFRACALGALDGQMAAVHGHDVFAEAETETRPLNFAGVHLVLGLAERLHRDFDFLIRHADDPAAGTH